MKLQQSNLSRLSATKPASLGYERVRNDKRHEFLLPDLTEKFWSDREDVVWCFKYITTKNLSKLKVQKVSEKSGNKKRHQVQLLSTAHTKQLTTDKLRMLENW
jgi:hypothetical protein